MNERDISSLDCKHKHMLLKTELHLTNLVSCTVCNIYIEFLGFNSRWMFQAYHTLVLGVNSFFA